MQAVQDEIYFYRLFTWENNLPDFVFGITIKHIILYFFCRYYYLVIIVKLMLTP